jgi:hypothetical protein
MKEKIPLPKDVGEVNGKVTIEFTDPLTQKIKERFVNKNIAFPLAWSSAQAHTVLANPDMPTLFITDNNDSLSPDFPFQKGNIIGVGGWLNQGNAEAGGLIGRMINLLSFRNKFLPDYGGLSHRFVYDFDINQLFPKIGSIALTTQYANFVALGAVGYTGGITSGGLQALIKWLPYSPANRNPHIIKKQRGYRCTSSGYLTVYNPLDEVQEMRIDITPYYISGQTYTYANTWIGVSATSDRCYIFFNHITVTNRRLFEFADDTFSTVTNTYTTVSNITVPISNFVVDGDWMYCINASGQWQRANYVTNTDWVEQTVPTCPYNTAKKISGADCSITVKDRLAFPMYLTSTALVSGIVWNTEENAFFTTVTMTGVNVASNYGVEHWIEHPGYPGNPLVHSSGISSIIGLSEQFLSRSAFTRYLVPDEISNSRPQGQGVRITYDLEVLY